MTDDGTADASIRDRMRSRVDDLGGTIAPDSAVKWARHLALTELAPGVGGDISAAVIDMELRRSATPAESAKPGMDAAADAAAAITKPAVSNDIGGVVGLVLGFAAPFALLGAVAGFIDFPTAMWIATGLLAGSVVILGATGGRANPQAAAGALGAGSLRLLAAFSIVTVLATLGAAFVDLDGVRIVVLCVAVQSFATVALFALTATVRHKQRTPRVAAPAHAGGAQTEEQEEAMLAGIRTTVERNVLPTLPTELQARLCAAELETIRIFRERGDIDESLAASASADIVSFWNMPQTT